MLDEEIKKARIQAMKDRDRSSSDVLSVVMNKIMLAKIDKREKGQELTDADVVSILQKTEKELYDEKERFEKAGRPEKVAELDVQISAVKKFIPAMMSEEEIREVLTTKFADVVATKNKGQIMKAVMAELKGKADGKAINQVVADLCK